MTTVSQIEAVTMMLQPTVEFYRAFPQVQAIGIGGSRAAGMGLADSDIDLYVYTTGEIPDGARQAFISARASYMLLHNDYWGAGDVWVERDSGLEVDAMYWETAWIEDQIARTLDRCEPWLGYTTAFWYTLKHTRVLYDRDGWLTGLVARCQQPYPEVLRTAIVRHNHAVLREIRHAYLHQIEKAIARADAVSVNHRVAALLASYFDIIFAVNRVPHPGEKRLVALAQALCPSLPEGFAGDVAAVVQASGAPTPEVAAALAGLLDRLDDWLQTEGLP